MGTNAIEPGAATLLIPADDTTEYYATLTGASVQLARSKSNAKSDEKSRPAPAGERGPMSTEANEELWAYNPDDNDSVAFLHLDHNGFFWQREPRAVVGGVLTSSDNEAAPASDEDMHVYGTDVDVADGDAVETLEMPDAAESLVVSVDDADGSYEVAVEFLDEPGGSVVTTRDGDNSGEFTGGSATDVFVEVLPASPHVRVRVTDTSGAANNTLDYSAYAR